MRPWLIAGLILAVDQLTKFVVAAAFHPGESLPLVPGALHLTYVQNTGAAFGLLKGAQVLFIVLSLAVIAWIARQFLAERPLTATALWAYALVLGGAAGNLIDRLRFGYVVDFIDVRVWPVFNLGDSAITIGVALLIWRALATKR
ncbi:MAG: signal peptidase II [Candidatus Omnitrophica bacterium]|nr:signal peptidase II [Candidatus Omnitrophota bacterium]